MPPMRRAFLLCAAVLAIAWPLRAVDGDWMYWRGPDATGMARGDAPLRWSDTEGIKWKANVPGRGFSSPVISGDRVFLTTAIPNDAEAAKAGLVEHRFVVLCYDRATGKLLWERVAKTATPHELHHPSYGSFASNSPVTDGTHVFAFFGSRGLYAYTMDGQLVWQKDFGLLRMYMSERAPGLGSRATRCSCCSITRVTRSLSRSTRTPGTSGGARRGKATRTGPGRT
jgi:hypothetical protein